MELFDFVPHLNSVESSDVVFVCGVGEVVDLNVVENGLGEKRGGLGGCIGRTLGVHWDGVTKGCARLVAFGMDVIDPL